MINKKSYLGEDEEVEREPRKYIALNYQAIKADTKKLIRDEKLRDSRLIFKG